MRIIYLKLSNWFFLCLLSLFSIPNVFANEFFENDWWRDAVYTLNNPESVVVGDTAAFSQNGNAALYQARVDANLLSREQGSFQNNGFDRLSATFIGEDESIGFSELNRDQAEQWAKDNSSQLMKIIFGSSPGRSLAGQDSAHTESSLVMEDFILLSAAKRAKQKSGVTINTSQYQVDGRLSYTRFDNDIYKGKSWGITLGYRADLNDKLSLRVLLPYKHVKNDESTDSKSHVFLPSIGLNYLAFEDEMSELNVGANLQGSGVYSKTDIGDLGYLRYSLTGFASYRYYVNDALTVTGGATLGFGQYTSVDLDDEYEYLEDAFDDLDTDTVLGLGALVEYEVNDRVGVDFFLYGARNFNSEIENGKTQVSFGPQLRYTVLDTFNVKLAYKRTQDMGGDNKYRADTFMLNAIYQF